MTFAVIESAIRTAMLERCFIGSEFEKTCIVSQALLETTDLCLEQGLITVDSLKLPDELDFYLSTVYHFLGDPCG